MTTHKEELTLRPSRSLNRAGKAAFYGGLAVAGALSTYFSVKVGFWPIAVFANTALAGTAFAMTRSTRSGHEYERIELDRNKVRINHFKPGYQEERVTELPAYMLRVEAICNHDGHCTALRLKSHGHSFEIGAFLPPEEKLEVAEELRNALHRMAQPDHLQPK